MSRARRRRRDREGEGRFVLTGRGRRLLLWTVGVGVGAFLVGYLLMAILFFPGGGAEVVTVPDLRGLSEAEAGRELEGRELQLERGSILVHPEVPEGAVLAQSPLPGEEVAPGTAVRLNLSAGREQRAVPDVSMLNGEQARRFLTRSGFEVEVDSVRDRRRAGRVVGVIPDVGTPVELPARIRLVISSGPPRVEIPDLLDLPTREAEEVLESVGLSLGDIDHDPFAREPLGSIVSQWPMAGDSLEMGSEVDVTISGSTPLPEVIRPRPRRDPPPGERVPAGNRGGEE